MRPLAILAASTLLAATAAAQGLPPGFFEEVVFPLSSFTHPDPLFTGQPRGSVATLEAFPDGRVFIGLGDTRGYLWDPEVDRLPNGQGSLPPYFVDYRGYPKDEVGIIGCVVAPDYETTRHFYLLHTMDIPPFNESFRPAARRIRIVRHTAHATSMNAVEEGSELVILDIADENIFTSIHFGGGMVFGNDGKLYVSLGDDATVASVQSLSSFRGKVLRMNPDGTAPPDNPFYVEGDSTARNYVWARGLRNPFRLLYEPVRDILWTTDTGQNLWEELNLVEPAANFGWPMIEGPLEDNPGVTPPENYTDAWWSYKHGRQALQGYAIVSALFYNGTMFPEEYRGDLFISDWGFVFAGGTPGEIFRLKVGPDGERESVESWYVEPNNSFGMADMTVLADGSLLFAVTYSEYGSIRRIHYREPDEPPVISISATPDEGFAPLQVQFNAGVEDEGTPTVAWNFGDGTTATGLSPLKTYSIPGQYAVTATARDEFNSLDTDTATVTVVKTLDSLSMSGVLRNSSAAPDQPVQGAITLYQADGVTPLSTIRRGDGIVIPTNPDGSFSYSSPPLDVFGTFIVADASASGLVTNRFTVPTSGDAAFFDGTVHLSSLALTGEVRRTDLDVPAPGIDVWVSLVDAFGASAPYEIPGGRDFAPPLTPLGFPTGVLSNDLGRFYVPLRVVDGNNRFQLTANLESRLDGFLASPQETLVTESGAFDLSIPINFISGGAACDKLIPPQWYVITFSQTQEIFNDHCIGCHGHVNPYMELDLTEGFAFSSITNVRSKEVPTSWIVEQRPTGYPATNGLYLIEKLTCLSPSIGAVMPPTGLITGKERRDVAQWIRNGALHSTTQVNAWASTEETLSPAIIQFRGGAEGTKPPFVWDWNFDDGRHSDQPHPRMFFFVETGASPKELLVELTVRNSLGATTGTDSIVLTIAAPPEDPFNVPPSVTLRGRSDLLVGAAFFLEATDVSDSDGQVVGFLWDLDNDGVADDYSIAPTLPHTILADGNFTIRVGAVDNKNAVTWDAAQFSVVNAIIGDRWMIE